jgi:hypothetical protein
MRLKIFISVIALAFIGATQCTLKERLDKSSKKIATFQKNIKSGKINVGDRCSGGCGSSCKTCDKG